jgi:hypothetical protein
VSEYTLRAMDIHTLYGPLPPSYTAHIFCSFGGILQLWHVNFDGLTGDAQRARHRVSAGPPPCSGELLQWSAAPLAEAGRPLNCYTRRLVRF